MQSLLTETVGGELYHYYPLGQHIVRAPGVCGGRPTFTYTRIEIAGTLDRIAAGEAIDDIVVGYRGRVKREAILEALHLVTTQFMATLPQLELA
ncbi:MAG: DUF433 domain-containing protein [Caldilineaceae bacterium]|jgi:uncharacterized protein (DUF433 family)